MGRALWLADAMRAEGLAVVEVDGWQTRGSSTFAPQGVICHHTAGPATGDMPSLKILINGRSDLPGPLAQIGLARSGTVYIIASGRANHAGTGGWGGMSGNTSVFGIEAENTGVGEPWSDAQLKAYVKVAAALVKGIGKDWSAICGHKEWTTRKIDPRGIDMDWFRGEVFWHIVGGAVPTPVPTPEPVPTPPTPKWVAESGALSLWEWGPRTKAWQHDLNTVAGQGLVEDGYFGESTDKATKNFQAFFGLTADGIVGPKTLEVMEYIKRPKPAWPGRYLKLTTPLMHGEDVRQYQQRLRDIGVGITVDGYYGAKSRDITKFLQTTWNLTADGIVGPATWDRAWA